MLASAAVAAPAFLEGKDVEVTGTFSGLIRRAVRHVSAMAKHEVVKPRAFQLVMQNPVNKGLQSSVSILKSCPKLYTYFKNLLC